MKGYSNLKAVLSFVLGTWLLMACDSEDDTSETPSPGADGLIEITENITEDFTMVGGQVYVVGDIDVEAGATLTIEPGAVVAGKYVEDGLASNDPAKERYRMTIDSGAVLVAEGTAENPIIMTSERAVVEGLGEPAPGDWKGLRLDGFAGSSGTMRYVRVEYGGALEPDDDFDGALQLRKVDAATTIDYVQVYRSLGFGFEIRGGSVNVRHAMVTEAGNTSLTINDEDDVPYTGNLQYVILHTDNLSTKPDRDLEVRDGAAVTMANLTMLGSGYTLEEGDISAIRVRQDVGSLRLFNSVVAEYTNDGVRVDAPNLISGIDGPLVVAHSYLFHIGDDVTRDESEPEVLPLPFETEADTYTNTIAADEVPPAAVGIGVGDFVPDAAISSSYNSSTLGVFFTDADFIGAIGSENWTSGWSLTTNGSPNP